MPSITFGIITVSDTCYNKEKIDTAGPKLGEAILKTYASAEIKEKRIVPDDFLKISGAIKFMIFNHCNVVFTVGGTGFSPRDITPEVTKAIIEKEAPALSQLMLMKSLEITDFAILSRAVCGIKGQSIIINLPGSAKAAVECFSFISKVLPHAVDVVLDKSDKISKTHHGIQSCGKSYEDFTPSKVKTDNPAKRNRESAYPMVEVDHALNLIRNLNYAELQYETIPLEDSLHRIIGDDIICNKPIPEFDASIKDGYAVKSCDGTAVRKVIDISAAGDKSQVETLKTGEAIRISTGAMIPPGADAVIQVEDTTLVTTTADGKEELEIKVNKNPTVGLDIRKRGSDLDKGVTVVNKATRITPYIMGILATLDYTQVRVLKKPTIGIISTGNELCPLGEELKPGQIRDSNKIALMNMLKDYDVKDCGTARDDPNILKRVLAEAFAKCDLVISTGGVSMGEFDLIKDVLVEDFQAKIHFGRVNMKPGKPTTFASLKVGDQEKLFFGLPGNPVSCCVTCFLFVTNAIRKLEGQDNFYLPMRKGILMDDIKNTDTRPEFLRVRIEYKSTSSPPEAYSTGSQVSSRLNSLVGADGLMYLPPKIENAQGQMFNIFLISK